MSSTSNITKLIALNEINAIENKIATYQSWLNNEKMSPGDAEIYTRRELMYSMIESFENVKEEIEEFLISTYGANYKDEKG